ncbi:hypothetical protein EYF80_006242 [Liparis tanakae]|uniref:Uncharacterized protein n=1 Tax=Liparis tanakae TaxID=230148 RepID=A0A4Z2IZY9_9TELE|nr:hypothetical protein EYF80_006242 [Liparis tanakae]
MEGFRPCRTRLSSCLLGPWFSWSTGTTAEQQGQRSESTWESTPRGDEETGVCEGDEEPGVCDPVAPGRLGQGERRLLRLEVQQLELHEQTLHAAVQRHAGARPQAQRQHLHPEALGGLRGGRGSGSLRRTRSLHRVQLTFHDVLRDLGVVRMRLRADRDQLPFRELRSRNLLHHKVSLRSTGTSESTITTGSSHLVLLVLLVPLVLLVLLVPRRCRVHERDLFGALVSRSSPRSEFRQLGSLSTVESCLFRLFLLFLLFLLLLFLPLRLLGGHDGVRRKNVGGPPLQRHLDEAGGESRGVGTEEVNIPEIHEHIGDDGNRGSGSPVILRSRVRVHLLLLFVEHVEPQGLGPQVAVQLRVRADGVGPEVVQRRVAAVRDRGGGVVGEVVELVDHVRARRPGAGGPLQVSAEADGDGELVPAGRRLREEEEESNLWDLLEPRSQTHGSVPPCLLAPSQLPPCLLAPPSRLLASSRLTDQRRGAAHRAVVQQRLQPEPRSGQRPPVQPAGLVHLHGDGAAAQEVQQPAVLRHHVAGREAVGRRAARGHRSGVRLEQVEGVGAEGGGLAAPQGLQGAQGQRGPHHLQLHQVLLRTQDHSFLRTLVFIAHRRVGPRGFGAVGQVSELS